MSDAILIIGMIIILMSIVGIIVGLFFWGAYLFDKNIACPNYSKATKLETKYNFWAGGCFVNYKGQWIPAENLRAGKLD